MAKNKDHDKDDKAFGGKRAAPFGKGGSAKDAKAAKIAKSGRK